MTSRVVDECVLRSHVALHTIVQALAQRGSRKGDGAGAENGNEQRDRCDLPLREAWIEMVSPPSRRASFHRHRVACRAQPHPGFGASSLPANCGRSDSAAALTRWLGPERQNLRHLSMETRSWARSLLHYLWNRPRPAVLSGALLA
jgi:hypothetical protein